MSSWVADLDSTIFTFLKVKFPTILKAKYPNIKFSNEDILRTEAKFPYVKIKIVSMDERGRDLQNNGINAVNVVLQVDVISNNRQRDANEIIYAILDTVKSMRFNIDSLPTEIQEGDIYRSTMRASRVLGSGDILI